MTPSAEHIGAGHTETGRVGAGRVGAGRVAAGHVGAGRVSRIERVRSWMLAEGLDCLIAAGAEHVNHLTGYSRYFGGLAAAVLDADGRRSLLLPRDEVEGAVALGCVEMVHGYGERGFGLVPDQTPLLAAALVSLAPVAQASRVGFASELASLSARIADLSPVRLVDADAQLRQVRLVKDEEELCRLARSYQLAWLAQEAVRAHLEAGTTEIELFTAGLASAQLAAEMPIEFVGDLLCGARTADVCAPISIAGPVAARLGEAVVADLVVGCEGYWGDTAATLVVGENAEVSAVSDALSQIRDEVATQLVPGRMVAEVFGSMRALIDDAFEGGEFPHHGGHGVGLSAYEDPHVIPTDESVLEAGMVIALEPGVYFPGRFGARVERMYIVGSEGGIEVGATEKATSEARGKA